MTSYAVYGIFTQFGPISDFNTNQENISISFIKTEGVIHLKTQQQIVHENISFDVKWIRDSSLARTIVDVDDSLKAAPEQQSPQNILNVLNDDCLQTIFDSSKFDIWDLCSIASVCKRFNDLVKRKIESKARDEKFTIFRLPQSNILCRFEEYIQNYVSKCSDIQIHETFMAGEMCAKYCKKVYVLRLWLDDDNTPLLELRPLVRQAHKLEVLFYTYTPDGWLWDLNELITDDCPADDILLYNCSANPIVILPAVNLSKLKSFTMHGIVVNDPISTSTFWSLNQQLEKLSLYQRSNTNCNIVEYLPNIEELVLTCGSYIKCDDDLEFKLGKLKNLSLTVFSAAEIDAFMTKLADSEQLLHAVTISCIPTNIHRFDSIRQLVSRNCADDQLLQIAQHLVHLESINVTSSNAITIDGIRAFVDNCGDCCSEGSFRIEENKDHPFDEDRAVELLANIAEERRIKLNVGLNVKPPRNDGDVR